MIMKWTQDEITKATEDYCLSYLELHGVLPPDELWKSHMQARVQYPPTAEKFYNQIRYGWDTRRTLIFLAKLQDTDVNGEKVFNLIPDIETFLSVISGVPTPEEEVQVIGIMHLIHENAPQPTFKPLAVAA
jgi:hypothetical protein